MNYLKKIAQLEKYKEKRLEREKRKKAKKPKRKNYYIPRTREKTGLTRVKFKLKTRTLKDKFLEMSELELVTKLKNNDIVL